MSPRIFAALFLLLSACAAPDDDNPVKGGDELSAYVGVPVAQARSGIAREGYRAVGVEDGSEYWLNRRSGACARTAFRAGILLTVVQVPRAVCQTVSR